MIHANGGTTGALRVPIKAVLLDGPVQVAKNAAMGIPPLRRARLRRPRAGAAYAGDVRQLERYAFQALRLLRAHVGSVSDVRIVEFGPGDTLAAGFALLAAGARSYTALDRFVGDHASAE